MLLDVGRMLQGVGAIIQGVGTMLSVFGDATWCRLAQPCKVSAQFMCRSIAVSRIHYWPKMNIHTTR